LSPTVLEASKLADRFIHIMKEQREDELSGWIENALKCSVAKQLTFADGSMEDHTAVKAALPFSWAMGSWNIR
jgi:hypothetical protein